MEGKSVLFKRFADIDAIDIEVEEEDAEQFIECVKRIGNTFGGINLEDIKAPESFIIEQRLRESLVFKADVHLVAPDTFEKPGAAKVAFVLRKYPDLP